MGSSQRVKMRHARTLHRMTPRGKRTYRRVGDGAYRRSAFGGAAFTCAITSASSLVPSYEAEYEGANRAPTTFTAAPKL